ncbi:MAG: hypothetical protein JWM21_181 [Acidobacteria bacterium]|nr:hypothetical protein [Acidobacteriota bacterium]
MKVKKEFLLLAVAGLSTFLAGGFIYSTGRPKASAAPLVPSTTVQIQSPDRPDIIRPEFDVQVLMNGRPLDEYAARGRTYVEALEGREYELRLRNPFPFRVAVALSVDGLNTIDAKHTTAWDASKWVMGPYETIDISGWQVSTARARHFYFTTERDSYGAKLGQTANLGVISAVFFRERQPVPVRVVPPPSPRSGQPTYEDNGASSNRGADAPTVAESKDSRRKSYPAPDDESAATGIGRSVSNDVRWVNMQLESRPFSDVTIRYEFYQGLVRLGILPRVYQRPDSLKRREDARGFEDRRFSPEP